MSACLIEERLVADPKRRIPGRILSERIRVSETVVDGRKQQEPTLHYPVPPVTDDDEIEFLTKAVLWMAVLAVTPLILFHILTYFYPDIFMIPVAPT